MEANMEGRKGNVRKRGCSSSSSSSVLMAPNYKQKRTFLMGKRRGSTTPVPNWKMIASHFQNGDLPFKDCSVSARKLAAVLWDIDRLHKHRFKMETYQNKKCGKERILKSSKGRSVELVLSDPFIDTVSGGKWDPSPITLCSCRRRALGGCRKLMWPSSNLRSSTSIPSFQGQVDEAQINEERKNLKEVHNGLRASKQLLEVLTCVRGVKQPSITLVSALKAELDRSCYRVSNLIRGQKTNMSETHALLKKGKHINAVPSLLGELERDKKLRRRGEKLINKTAAELAEAKASLAMAMKEAESEKKTRRKVEQVCEELARGIWELKRQFATVREEVEKEREMFQLADLLREERVQMKLSEAKCLYEEQNAVIDKLKNELAAYLDGAKSNEVERVLEETQQNQNKGSEKNAATNEDDEEESDDSDLEPIELRIEGIGNGFLWGNGSESEERKCISEAAVKGIVSSKLQENQEFFPWTRLSEFT